MGVIFAAAIVPIATRPVWDIDAWWLAAVGRDIASSGHFPHTNGFSFVEPDHPWILHEWLFAVLFRRALGALGPGAFALVAMLGAWVVLGLVLAATLARARDARFGLLFSVAIVLGVLDKLDSPRPLYLSIAFALLTTHLAFGKRFSWASVAAVTLVELVWTNAHGSFPLGLALLAASATETPSDRSRRLTALGTASAVTLLNPYGASLWSVVARYTFARDPASALIRSTISGFLPLWRAPWTFVDAPLVLTFAIVVVMALVSVRRPEARVRAIVALVLCGLAVVHVRNLVVAVCVSAVLLAPVADKVELRAIARRLGVALAPPLLAGLVAFVVASRARPREAWFAPVLGGPSFVRLAGELPDGARAFVPFRSTGLLMWLEAPRGVRVLFDARNDCYSADVIETAFALNGQTLPPSAAREAVERYGTSDVIVDVRDPLFEGLSAAEARERWTLARRDGDWALFRSSGTPR